MQTGTGAILAPGRAACYPDALLLPLRLSESLIRDCYLLLVNDFSDVCTLLGANSESRGSQADGKVGATFHSQGSTNQICPFE